MRRHAKLAAVIPLVALVVIPALVLVASANSNQPNEAVWNPTILKGPLVTCTGAGGPGNIPQCTTLCDLVSTAANVVYFAMGVIIWLVVPIMVAWGGVRILVSRGQPGGISEGKKIITGTVIGLLITLAAYLIVLTFVHVLGISGVGGFTSNGACVVQPYSGAPGGGGGGATSSSGGSTKKTTGGSGTASSPATCSTSNDCTDNQQPICTNSKCGACTNDNQCQDAYSDAPKCNTTTGECVAVSCTDSSSCTSDQQPICDGGQCVGCTSDPQCADAYSNAPYCNLDTGSCETTPQSGNGYFYCPQDGSCFYGTQSDCNSSCQSVDGCSGPYQDSSCGGQGGGSSSCGSDCSQCNDDQQSCEGDTADNCFWDSINSLCYVDGQVPDGGSCYSGTDCQSGTCTGNVCGSSSSGSSSGGAGSCGSDCSGCPDSGSCGGDPNCYWDGSSCLPA